MAAAAVKAAATKAAQAADAAAAAKGLNDNAHGIDRFGYRVRCHSLPSPSCVHRTLARFDHPTPNPLRHNSPHPRAPGHLLNPYFAHVRSP